MTNGSVEVTLADRVLKVSYGLPVGDLLSKHLPPGEQPALAAIVHNRCVDLRTPLTAATEVQAVDYTTRQGVLVYRRTASLILIEAVRRLLGPVRVSIGQSHENGYFYGIHSEPALTVEQVRAIEQQMQEIVAADLALRVERVSWDEACEIFSRRGARNKLQLLQTWREPDVELVHCGESCDVYHAPVAPRTGLIETFTLVHESTEVFEPGGVLLRFPPRGRPQPIAPFVDSPKLMQTYREARSWLNILGVETVGQLNELTLRGEGAELIRIAEGLHEKKIANIADHICQARTPEPVRLVLIAGPSSSGKTTLSKRLSLQLRVNGVRPVGLSTDNFYVNRDDTPRDEHGKLDFEAIEAIDLDLFNEVLARLLRGEQVLTPRFDFPSGQRKPKDKWRPMQLAKGQVLLVEGIHGLNPRLTEAVAHRQKFSIYINALTQLCIDDYNRIFTSDTRFLRRIVRDRLFRGYSAAQTINNWPSVRRGEQRNIFPFQEEADVMFNSAMPYEQSVLRLYAERFLLEVSRDDPAYVDAHRMLRFVSLFVPMFAETIPETSLLREFIGGSGFEY